MPSEPIQDVTGPLAGRVVVCTGAAGALGAEVARTCAGDGARVVCVDRASEPNERLVADLPGRGHLAITGDVTQPPFRHEVFARVIEELGAIDGFVDCAGFLDPRPLFEMDDAHWDQHLDVNVKAAFGLAQAAAQAMIAGGRGGRIVLVSSSSWLYGGTAGRLAYASTKAAVITMARGLARQLGPHAITVNTVTPALIESPMMATGLADATRDALIADSPLGRFGTPAEVAGPVAFLLSERASFISGATLNISGAFTLY